MTVNAPSPLSGNMDVDEFMAFMETRPKGEHWDLIEGVAVMMAPASYAHQRIASNLCHLLNGAFAARHLDLYAYFDVGVRSPGVRNFQPEPDVAVVPGVAGTTIRNAFSWWRKSCRRQTRATKSISNCAVIARPPTTSMRL